MTRWTFDDPRDLGVITTDRVLDGKPILLVTHDSDDGGWQFLCGTTNDPEHGRIVELVDIVEMDETVSELHDLPLGWMAERDAPDRPWQRRPNPQDEVDNEDDD